MALGSTLLTVRNMVKAEAGLALTSESTGSDALINQLLDNEQSLLNTTYNWPFMYKKWDATVSTRYTAFPTATKDGLTADINFDRAVAFWVKYSNQWQGTRYGIGPPELNHLDSDAGATQDPILRWQIYDTARFEVWPFPATAQTCQFCGQKVLTSLKTTGVYDDTKTLDLDDLLLALRVASSLLASREQPNAMLVTRRAEQRLLDLRAAGPSRQSVIHLGGPRFGRRRLVATTGSGVPFGIMYGEGGEIMFGEGGDFMLPG